MCVGCVEVKLLEDIATQRDDDIVQCECDCGAKFKFKLYVIQSESQTIDYELRVSDDADLLKIDADISRKSI